VDKRLYCRERIRRGVWRVAVKAECQCRMIGVAYAALLTRVSIAVPESAAGQQLSAGVTETAPKRQHKESWWASELQTKTYLLR
jgi:hypothetical protein